MLATNPKLFEFPLYEAVKEGKVDVLTSLLKQGVNPSGYVDDNGNTALHLAATTSPNIIALLLQYGADHQKENTAKKKPLQLASDALAWDCILEFTKYNETKTDPKLSYDLGGPLLMAINKGKEYESHVVSLVKGKANLLWHFTSTTDGVLHAAVLQDASHIIRLLLQAGADMTKSNKNTESPVLLAAKKQRWNCLKTLARFKNTTGNNNPALFDEALLLAAQANRLDVVEVLLRASANPNNAATVAVDTKNFPLHEAACRKNKHMISLLAINGATQDVKNIAQDTPIDITTKLHDWENIDTYSSPQLFSLENARHVMLLLLIVSEDKKNKGCFFAKLPVELRELIFQYAFNEFNDFNFKLGKMQDDSFLCSIKGFCTHIERKKQARFFPSKVSLELSNLANELNNALTEVSSVETKIEQANNAIQKYLSIYRLNPEQLDHEIDLLIKFHLVPPSQKISVYWSQVNAFCCYIEGISTPLLFTSEKKPLLNRLCAKLRRITKDNNFSPISEKQLKMEIKAFLDAYGDIEEVTLHLDKFHLRSNPTPESRLEKILSSFSS